MMAIIGTLAYNFQTVLPLFTTRDLHGTDVTFTWLMSVVSVGSLLGALATARRKTINVRIVSRNAAISGRPWRSSPSPRTSRRPSRSGSWSARSITFMTAATAITQLAADPSMRGRILALQAIVFLGSTPVGGPIVGAISETFGARYAIALGALATMAASGFGYFTTGAAARPSRSTTPPRSLPGRRARRAGPPGPGHHAEGFLTFRRRPIGGRSLMARGTESGSGAVPGAGAAIPAGRR